MSQSSPFAPVEEFDAAQTLAAAEQVVRDRRANQAREVEVGLHWADLHATEPDQPGRPVPTTPKHWQSPTPAHSTTPSTRSPEPSVATTPSQSP